MPLGHSASRPGGRTRTTLLGVSTVVVALIAIALAVGGSGSNGSAGGSGRITLTRANSLGVAGAPAAVPTPATQLKALRHSAQGMAPLPSVAVQSAPQVGAAAPDYATTTGGGSGSAVAGGVATDSSAAISSGSSLAATRIVKTGSLSIRVANGEVQSKSDALVALATSEGGYVTQSSTNLGSGAPYGEVVLRIPVAHFEDAIAQAQKLGHVLTVTRSADDVTGKYVDLAAKKRALERTRSTYLSILSRARTIGATLAVQERIDEVQQQIDQLHGQLKLIANQSSYSTLTVDVVPSGVKTFAETHHRRHGIGKAWHDSWSRFDRGINAIVGAIGPIVFALLLLAALGLIGLGGYRGYRRMTARPDAAA